MQLSGRFRSSQDPPPDQIVPSLIARLAWSRWDFKRSRASIPERSAKFCLADSISLSRAEVRRTWAKVSDQWDRARVGEDSGTRNGAPDFSAALSISPSNVLYPRAARWR